MSLSAAARRMNDATDELRSLKIKRPQSVFLSYARPDQPLVEELAARIVALGYTAWWDAHIDAGAVFDQRIADAIDAAFAVVVVWSPHSLRSSWVKWEARRGHRQGKLVPLAVPEFDLADLWPPFADLNTLAIGEQARLAAALHRLAASRMGGADLTID